MIYRFAQPKLRKLLRQFPAVALLVRDSGLLHALLGIRNIEELLGHPIVGQAGRGC